MVSVKDHLSGDVRLAAGAAAAGRRRLACDVGGTFTDCVSVDDADGALSVHKRLTDAVHPDLGVLAGLESLVGGDFASAASLAHATTLVTNALIEHRGALVALVTTRGFRDLLDIGQEFLYDINDLSPAFPAPLVARNMRWELDERVDVHGRVLREPAREDVDRILDEIARSDVEAVAVCMVHAYRNPAHERLVRDALRERLPQLPVSLSSDVCPEIREFERTCTTAANAFTQPLAQRYLFSLDDELKRRGLKRPFRVMASSGTSVPAAQAAAQPIHILESGPAAGAVAAGLVGTLAEVGSVLSFDMGGTTAKIALVRDGTPDYVATMEAARVKRFQRGSGVPLLSPSVDLLEIGAGGGSIASVDAFSLLRIGPRSAGSSPGPACYGFGGSEATVTDANVVLGLIDPDFFLGGEMPLDDTAAWSSLAALGGSMGGIDAATAASAVHRLVNENMAAAAQVHLVERGCDPRALTMVAFGGCGPVHGAGVARALGCVETIIAPASGVLSALGLLVAAPAVDLSRSFPARIAAGQVDWATIRDAVAELGAAAVRRLEEQGHQREVITLALAMDCRYVGQLHEVAVPINESVVEQGDEGALTRAFIGAYSARYGGPPADAVIEILTWRVRASAPSPGVRLPPIRQSATPSPLGALKGERPAVIGLRARQPVPVYDRYLLEAGMAVAGPALIEERETTVVVLDGMTARVDERGLVRIHDGQ